MATEIGEFNHISRYLGKYHGFSISLSRNYCGSSGDWDASRPHREPYNCILSSFYSRSNRRNGPKYMATINQYLVTA